MLAGRFCGGISNTCTDSKINLEDLSFQSKYSKRICPEVKSLEHLMFVANVMHAYRSTAERRAAIWLANEWYKHLKVVFKPSSERVYCWLVVAHEHSTSGTNPPNYFIFYQINRQCQYNGSAKRWKKWAWRNKVNRIDGIEYIHRQSQIDTDVRCESVGVLKHIHLSLVLPAFKCGHPFPGCKSMFQNLNR